MRIAIFASEMEPYIKTGGLADVMGTLPYALLEVYPDIYVDMYIPYYGPIKNQDLKFEHETTSFSLKIGSKRFNGQVFIQKFTNFNLQVHFINNYRLFSSRSQLYAKDGKDYRDNLQRFIFFCRGSLEYIKNKYSGGNPYQIFHLHDWQSALISLFIKLDDFFSESMVKSVFTIHNLNYQGKFPASQFPLLGIGKKFFTPKYLEFWGKINLMKAGLIFSDKLTTVSPTYANEIQTKTYGAGLEGIIKERKNDLVGILNGVNYSLWNPEKDKLIPKTYSSQNLSGKAECKLTLQKMFNLPEDLNIPLLGVVTRLTWQKGTDLLLSTIRKLLSKNIQFILVGMGDPREELLYKNLQKEYSNKVGITIAFNNELAHLVEAGADIFLMPSRYEPCGLNDKYSLKYGTIPIVFNTGGLADSVTDYILDKENGTGFIFYQYTQKDFLETIEKALHLFESKDTWLKIMKRGMSKNFSWKNAAKAYLELFNSIIEP
ncbi:glycogen synthase GlgA [Candidatus Hodarchaeum mangrovi]